MREGQRGHFEIEMGTGDLVWVPAGIRAQEFEDDVQMNVEQATEDTVKDQVASGSTKETET